MRTKSHLDGEPCDRMLDGLRAIYGLVDCTDADFAFLGNVVVCVAGISRAGRPDEENGARTCKIRGILFSQVSGSGNRHRLADVPLLALKCVDFRDGGAFFQRCRRQS